MARRRSRRRKSSYSEQAELSGVPAELVVEDLSPRARRLAESGVIDLSSIVGSGEGGRITSGDILHAARVMEMEQSVARIEAVGRPIQTPEPGEKQESDLAPEPAAPPETAITEPDAAHSEPIEGDSAQAVASETEEPRGVLSDPAHSDATTSSSTDVGGDAIEVPPSPWDAYNGSSDGLSESALPGAEQSWGEAEANIAAIAEEAAARTFGRQSVEPVSPAATGPDAFGAAEPYVPVVDEVPIADGAVTEEQIVPPGDEAEPVAEAEIEPEVEPEPAVENAESAEQPTAVVAALSDIEAAVDLEPVSADEESVAEATVPAARPTDSEEPRPEPRKAMMDFGTLELVDPESVWAEGAEDFAPWFLAHSKQLGDVLGLEAGLAEARQFTTKSATGVLGRDDGGEDVVVVSSQEAVADDSDLGRALGMAASSGAATVALVSAKFNEDQLKALSWLNNQTKSGVRWFGIEMRVVRIADSPAAMLFDLVAAPPNA